MWLTTGMVTREWVAVHRKHHAKVETSPSRSAGATGPDQIKYAILERNGRISIIARKP
jgi:hypothetical protein